MFRGLKNVYFLSTKNNLLNNRWQKPQQIIRFISPSKTSPDASKILRLLTEAEPDWEKVLKNVGWKEQGSEREIMKFCGQNQLGRQLLSFVEYLIAHNRFYGVTIMDFLRVIDLGNYFQPCYPIVYNLFVKYVSVDREIAKRCARILLKSPLYSDKVLQICKENRDTIKVNMKLISVLNSSNKLEEASSLFDPKTTTISALIDTLLKLLNSEAYVDVTEMIIMLISKLSFSKDKDYFYKTLKKIMTLVNEKDINYFWELNGNICNSTKCKFCSKHWEICSVTEDELNILMAEFKQNIVLKYLSLPTTSRTWSNYVEFLDCHDYEIVIDGLNLFYSLNMDCKKFHDILNVFSSHKMRPLVVMKHKLKGVTDINSPHLFYNLLNDEYDDFYVLYAALKRGKGCKIISCDNYGFFPNVLKKHLNIFRKWRDTHFIKIRREGTIIWPLGVPYGKYEEPCLDPSEFKCHVTLQDPNYYGFTFCIKRSKLQKN